MDSKSDSPLGLLKRKLTFDTAELLQKPFDKSVPTEVTQSVGCLVKDTETLDLLMEKVAIAQQKWKNYNQEQVDDIFSECAMQASRMRLVLAKLAVEETEIGTVEDKTIKNNLASEYVFNHYKNEKTVGVVERDVPNGYSRVADPVGILAGIVPTTNPTSTTIFKALLAVKTRNPIVFSPHPRAARCTIAAAKIVRDAAISMGAPADCIGWIDVPSVPLCSELMKHPRTAMIVATGAGALVKAAYSSGKPAMGGGAGNTPVIIDETADIEMTVNSVILSKCFDNGVICASEQCVVCVKAVEDEVRTEFIKRGAHFLNDADKKLVADFIINDAGGLNPTAVGISAMKIAELAGCTDVPPKTRLLIGNIESVGPEEKLSHEKLCPCLSFNVVDDFNAAVNRAYELVMYGGMGHTAVLYTDLYDQEECNRRVQMFQEKIPTGRLLVGMPTSHGAIGDSFNPRQVFSLSLGCGSWGMNATAEGLQAKHILNYKTVSERRPHMQWFNVPKHIYFNRGSICEALKDLHGMKVSRALVVTDHQIKSLGFVRRITDALHDNGVDFDVFADISSLPNTTTISLGVQHMKSFKPDCIVAVGGGSAMDAAKLMRLVYEHPELALSQFATRFNDMRKRVAAFPNLGLLIKKVVCIPTTSGTGAEMTPFALYYDKPKKATYPIMDYALTPDMVIIDTDLVTKTPKNLVVRSGFLALSHALESHVSMMASEYTHCLSMQSVKLITKNLVESAMEADFKAREAVHSGASIGAMAVANTFVGIAESLAAQLLGNFEIPWGIAQAMVICQVIKFNANDAPTRQGTFPQYTRPLAKEQYAELVDHLGLPKGKEATLDEKVMMLIEHIQQLKKTLGVPDSLAEYGLRREVFDAALEKMSYGAFDDQCTGTNPRYPFIVEMKELLQDAYEGRI